MNILHIITSLGMGGAEAMLYKLIQAQPHHNHIVICLNGDGVYKDRLEDLGVEVICLYPKKLDVFTRLAKLSQRVKSFSPDVTMAWMYHSFIFSLFLSGRKKTIWNVRQTLDGHKSDKLMTRIIIRIAGWLSFVPMFICHNSQRGILQHERIGYKSHKAKFIPNGFDVDKFSLNYPDVSTQGKVKFVNVARNHPAKGHDILFSAFDLYLKSYGDATLDCYGYGVNEQEMQLKTHYPDIVNKVKLHGVSTSIQEVLSSYDVYVSPSRKEGFPNVVGEALVAGLVIAATDVGDCSSVVSCHGVLASEVNAAALAQAMQQASTFSFDKKSRSERTRYAADAFSMENVVASYEQLYNQVKAST
ncbi:glycosyltransferase [Pseudoalteromonas sp. DL2-H2.2]|uniref:glycosyltransferase n=1 Tax=Pseudoalteromonas sp. DL2-H2.2 TaxID=2908889 RepID=UPI001F172CBE|nr:glycosyltransferase [Pseudoalteromonas sp. DL2-H2.2]MCF2908831.1 glycosyltransferase [Pseudoalteromonas sp. DL2-H2.2]